MESLKRYVAMPALPLAVCRPVGAEGDGPLGVGPFFVLGGQEIRLRPASFKLLKRVWECRNCQLDVDTLEDDFFRGKSDDPLKPLRQAIYVANQQIVSCGIKLKREGHSIWIATTKRERVRKSKSVPEASDRTAVRGV